jgi:hypothetical protein
MDKSGWNSFFDDLCGGFEQSGIIFIMTTNAEDLNDFRPVREDGKRDVSYIREGRVDLTHQMMTPIPLREVIRDLEVSVEEKQQQIRRRANVGSSADTLPDGAV